MVFKSVMYAVTKREASEKFHTVTAMSAFDDNAQCDQYFESLWTCQEEWA